MASHSESHSPSSAGTSSAVGTMHGQAKDCLVIIYGMLLLAFSDRRLHLGVSSFPP